jgi:uracil-DNA glycosylase family 4
MDINEWLSWISNQSPVPPRGDIYAQAVLVGEAPGNSERLYLRPFCGEAGRLLSRLLQNSGIKEHSLFIDNISPFQPKNNDDESIPAKALTLYISELKERLSSLPNLNLIVPLGSLALSALTGKQGITKWHGSFLWTELGGRKVKTIATYHPAYLLRSPAATGQVLRDLEKIKAEIPSPEILHPPPKRTFLIFPKAKEVREFLTECESAPMVSLDIETNPKEKQIICLGLAPSPTLAMCIPWQTGRKEDRLALKEFLAKPQIKLGQNAALFDAFWLSWHGCPVNNLTIDTLYMHHCLDPQEEHSLATLAALFTQENFWKDEAIDSKEGTSVRVLQPSEGTFLYNLKDATITYEIALVLIDKLKAANKWDFYLKHYAALFPALLSMMLGGVRVDQKATETRFSSLTAELRLIESQLETLAGAPLVAKTALSRQKEAAFLYETLGLPKKWTKGENKSGKKSLSTSEDTIRKLMEKFPKKLQEIGPLLLDHAKKQKLSTFFNLKRMQQEEEIEAEIKAAEEKTFRFYFTLKPSTGTGRLASSKSPFKTGANGQNISREARTIYLPEPGHILCEIDGCLQGETLVETVRGPRFIKDIVPGEAVFSLRDQRVTIGEVTHTACTGVKPLWCLRLDSGEDVIGTADHRFPLIRYHGNGRGKWKGIPNMERLTLPLCELLPGDALLPLKKTIYKGRELLYSRSSYEYSMTHQLVAEAMLGPRPPGYEVHHKDENPLNNQPENLEYLERREHKRRHAINLTHVDQAKRLAALRIAAKNRDTRGEKNSNWGNKKGDYLSCFSCGNEFYREPFEIRDNRKFCSRPCYFQAKRLNHRVVSVEPLGISEPVYAITVIPDHNYALSCGIFTMNSQVESRICYVHTGDPELLRLANTKPWEYDAHKENAARIFEKPIATITKEERYTAKISVHSAQRAGTGRTLQGTFLKEQGIFKSVAECQGYIDSYFKAFPAIKEYFRGIQSQLFRERKLTNLWGREITFPFERFSEEMFREAYSFPLQSECAEWMNLQGVIPLHNWIRERGAKSRLLLTVHDSLLISLDPLEAWDLLSFIVPSLEAPIAYPAGPLVIPVEISLGKNWGEKLVEWKKPPSQAELLDALALLQSSKGG